MPHKQYFAGTLLGMSSCASYVSRTHDVIDDVIRSQSRSHCEIAISPSIFELERRSKVQNVGNANGYLACLSPAQNGGYFENFEISNTAPIWHQIWKDHIKLCQKSVFIVMTSSLTSQGNLKVGDLYSFINEITTQTLFMITEKRAKTSSLNFPCIGVMRLWVHLYKYIFMTSLMTSHGHKVGQILKLTYLRQYLS